MSSLTRRTLILVICRVLNYGVMLLSPIVMVRLFDPTSYGQYREFVLYSTLISGVAFFSVMSSPIYFIPKYPDRERQTVTQTALMLLVLGTLAAGATWLFGDLIRAHTSRDFIVPLVVQVFLMINLEYFESYMLGRKRTDIVLYFSTTRAALHLAVITAVAWITGDVMKVVWALVLVEGAKCAFTLAATAPLFTRRLDGDLLRRQLRYILPLGTATGLARMNIQLSKVVISARMGAESLAIYTIGSYQVPVIHIVRSSIMDVLFPEMAQVGDAGRITLWKRATVVFCFLAFPAFGVFFWHARTLIELLFTAEYLDAVPLFRVYLALMILQCFEMSSPLRAINRNVYFILGSLLSLTGNLGLILALFGSIGILAPAVAYIIGETVFLVYLASRVMAIYRIGIANLVMWRKIFLIILACAVCLPLLYIGGFAPMPPALRAIASSLLYLAAYLAVARRLRIEEIDLLFSKLTGIVSRKMRRGKDAPR